MIDEFKSDEEWEFWHWLLEARHHGLVSEIGYQPKTYTLSEKIEYPHIVHLKTKEKIVYKTLFSDCTYTPDFQFKVLNDGIREHIKKLHTVPYDKVIVDTKGTFAGKNNTSAATFPVKAKWLFQRHGLYVEKVIPVKLFKKTWVPEVARYTPKKKDIKKMYLGVKTIREYLNDSI